MYLLLQKLESNHDNAVHTVNSYKEAPCIHLQKKININILKFISQ